MRGSSKSKSSEKKDDTKFIPLPIQSFLWRQTNPFMGAKIGKLHEASCVTFERVIVQNILHGLSPSLSDAIASVPRWRLICAAFPHVVTCCAALLANRRRQMIDSNDPSLFVGHLSSSEVKLLYILHWMVFDSASECLDGDADNPDRPLEQCVFPLNSIQIFIYLMAPLVGTLCQEDLDNALRLEGGM